MDTVLHQTAMIDKFGQNEDDKDYDRVVGYCTSILTNCPASVRLSALKIEYLLLANKLKEASTFSNDLIKDPEMGVVPLLMSWRGRVMIYSGSDVNGKKMLQEALRRDPDLVDAMKALKMIKTVTNAKEEAGALFKDGKLEEAIAAFDHCLTLDPLNLTYNATI